MTSLAALVAAAPGSLVLPSGDRRAVVDVPEPLRLLDSADFGDGRHIGVVEDSSGARWTVPLVLDDTGVRRAAPGDGIAEALVAALITWTRQFRAALKEVAETGESQTWAITGDAPARSGLEAFEPPSAFHLSGGHDEQPPTGERGITVDQTNESVVVGERAMVKWAVQVPRAGVRGAQPARGHLSALGGSDFTETPMPWGLLLWSDQEHETSESAVFALLASVTAYLPGAQDGWDWAVDDVRRTALGEATLEAALDGPARLGGLTARMHVALAAGPGTRPADAAEVARWHARALADLDDALRLTPGDEGLRLQALASRVRTTYDEFDAAVGTPLMHVHGDFHVGQILRTAREGDGFDYAVTDFDGNPVLAPEERSDPQPAALDVAGMLASLDHVGRVVVTRVEGADPDVVDAWIVRAQATYLDAYVTTLDQLGEGGLFDSQLLAPLRAQQEIREYLYAARHLPHWVYVPDAALPALFPASG